MKYWEAAKLTKFLIFTADRNDLKFFATLFLFFGLIAPVHGLHLEHKSQSLVTYKVSSNIDFFVSDIRGISGQDILMNIKLPQNITPSNAKNTWLRILGMPEELSFSKGAKVDNVWFISVRDLTELILVSPSEYKNSFSLDFFLMRGEKSIVSIIAKKTIQVELVSLKRQSGRAAEQDPTEIPDPLVQQPNTERQDTQSIASPTDAEQQGQNTPNTDTAQPGNNLNKLSEEEETVLLSRGEELLSLGSFATARTIYENLAKRGSAKAALALAKTYDPEFIQKTPFSAIQPDIAKSKLWYKRATELGSTQAAVRLSEIEALN